MTGLGLQLYVPTCDLPVWAEIRRHPTRVTTAGALGSLYRFTMTLGA